MVSFELFVRPALLTMMGAKNPLRETTSVALVSEVRPSDRIEFQRAIIAVASNGRLRAETTGNQISSRLASLLGANGLLIIEPGTEPLLPGAMVPAILVGIPHASAASPLASSIS